MHPQSVLAGLAVAGTRASGIPNTAMFAVDFLTIFSGWFLGFAWDWGA